INGFQCEVLIPNEPHINVLRENNCSDWEGYANGIKYMENKYNKPIYELYNYIFFMNCSILGPFMDSDINDHWLLAYYYKIENEKSFICGNIINNLPADDLGGPGLRISCYNFLLKTDQKVIDL